MESNPTYPVIDDSVHRKAKRQTRFLAVALGPADHATVRRAAFLSGETVSAFIRQAAMRAARRATRRLEISPAEPVDAGHPTAARAA